MASGFCIMRNALYIMHCTYYYTYALYIIQTFPVISSGIELVWFLILHLTDLSGICYGVRYKARFIFPDNNPFALVSFVE